MNPDSAAISSIATDIALGLLRFLFSNVFIMLLNYMQYKLDFTQLIDMYII